MNQDLSGWVQEHSWQCDVQAPTPTDRIVTTLVRKNGSQRSYSLCNRRDDFKPKSNLMNDKENTECPTDNANKIQELKQVMEFLQHNESYKYSTHRTFDINDPKFQPAYQQMIQDKKQKIKQQFQSRFLPQNFANQAPLGQQGAVYPKQRPLIPLPGEMTRKNNSNVRQLSIPSQTRTIEVDKTKEKTTIKLKFQKFIIQQQQQGGSKKHFKTDALEELSINRIYSKQNIPTAKVETPKTLALNKSKAHISHDGLTKKGYLQLIDIKEKQKLLRQLEQQIKGFK